MTYGQQSNPFLVMGAGPQEGGRLDRGGGLGVRLDSGEEPSPRARLAEMAPALRDVAHQQVHVEVVGVMAVGAWAEHGVKLFAGPGECLPQKGPFPRGAPTPAVEHGDHVPVREPEGGNIERVAEGVFRQWSTAAAIAATAAIGGHLLYLNDLLPELAIGRLLHGVVDPAVEARRERATKGRRGRDFHSAALGGGDFERRLKPTGARAINGRNRVNIRRCADAAFYKACSLGLATPSCAAFRRSATPTTALK